LLALAIKVIASHFKMNNSNIISAQLSHQAPILYLDCEGQIRVNVHNGGFISVVEIGGRE
jgi:hypothetical protein